MPRASSVALWGGAIGIGVESKSTDYEIGTTLKVVDATTSRVITTLKT